MPFFDRLKQFLLRKPPVVEVQSDDSAPGWDAIDEALKTIYHDQEPLHWGTLIRWMLGGRDPLDGVSAYRNDGPPPHWHFVSYGMSELYAKDSDNAEVSGWGFEFTFRLRREEDDAAAPVWAVNFLQNLGRYVFDTGNTFRHGHYIDCNGPIRQGAETDLVAVLFRRDPQLPPRDTPHGRLQFLQVIGLTRDEYEACRAWSSEAFAAVLHRMVPLGVTDLARKSILDDPAVAREIEEGQALDGSSSGSAHLDQLTWRREGKGYVVGLSALAAGALPQYLRGRLPHGRPFTLIGPEHLVVFTPGTAGSVSENGPDLLVTLTDASVQVLSERLRPKRGTVEIEGTNLTIEVLPAVIRNSDGSIVEEVG
jgi:suppressor of fused-like protein